MSDTLEKVKSVTANLLKVDEGSITAESKFVEDLGAESMQSVELVASFEEEFDIEMDEEEAMNIKTVGEAAAYIDKVMQEQH
jgi:acyl carrier protein